jgi:hypothetical protein
MVEDGLVKPKERFEQILSDKELPYYVHQIAA